MISSSLIARLASFSPVSSIVAKLSAGFASAKRRIETLSLFSLIPYLSYVLVAVAVVGAILALVYIPSPFKHIVIDACIIAAVAAQVYALGFEAADTLGKAQLATAQAQFDTTIANFNNESAKAVAAAAAAAQAESALNIAQMRTQLDAQSAAAAQAAADYQRALAEVGKAQADADQPAPGVILDAIGGAK